MPVCSRLESWSVRAAGDVLRFNAVPHRNATMPVDFARLLGRLMPGWRISESGGTVTGRAPSGWDEDVQARAETILDLIETSVTIKDDHVDGSHALRMHQVRDEETGEWVHSDIGKLVRAAKSYREWSSGDRRAAVRLADEMLYWIEAMPPYSAADMIVPAPSTNPDKEYDLPAFIAQYLSSRISKPIVAIQSSNEKAQKDLPESEKTSARDLARQYRVTGDVRAKAVLVLDDIYESGGTVDAVALALRAAGTRYIFALTATKTAKYCNGLTPNTENWPMEA